MARIIYRDKDSGRFVKRATWTRSKAQGGKRYVRQKVKQKPEPTPESAPEPEEEPEQEEPEEFEDIELVGGFDSPGKKKK